MISFEIVARKEEHVLDGLVVHLRGLDVRRDGVGKVAKLANIRGGVDVDTLREVVVRRIRCGEVRRQTAVHRWVDQLCALREQELADVVDGQARLLHRVGDSHRLEVAAVVNDAGLPVNERVVGGCESALVDYMLGICAYTYWSCTRG